VAVFLGRDPATGSWATTVGNMVAGVAYEAASAHCRGVGFSVDVTDAAHPISKLPADLRWVVLMRAVRMAQNYSQLISEGRDSVSMLYGSAGQGWTLNELTALEAYRRTAA
jgi:hypothetical protein